MKKSFMCLVSLVTLTHTPLSFSTDLNSTTKATATLNSFCSISGTTIDIGELSGEGVGVGAGTISVFCSNNVSYSIALNLGVNSGGQTTRNLSNGKGNKINYIICKTSAQAANGNCVDRWYTGGGYSYLMTGIGNGQNQDYPAYGIASKDYYTPGIYTDTITATINY